VGFKMGDASVARATDYDAWKELVEGSIARHKGILKRVSQDLGIGYSTLKRWIQDEESFKKAVSSARRGKGGQVLVRQVVQARRRLRRAAVA
jgi:hypothetical protein